MIDNNKKVRVRSRDNGRVCYSIPEMNNLHREFSKNEVKEISYGELKQLSYIPGGMVILKEYLVIEDKEVLADIVGQVEPEYHYTEADIRNVLINGTIDQFLDFLDWAPTGAIDTMKEIAVKEEVSDIRKRDAILAKTGFNVTKAIEINHASEEPDEEEETKTRRAAVPTTSAADSEKKVRREPPKYNVVG